uniref:Uncharacterized protein n=1 Tax=Nelumbo nucifera TaxID=4432 RepID=A0A822ZVD8_NELNU|nr:TPA_asm: hypothetical protein HUJ06_018900 [Nelumbo nucifera]
MGCLEYNSLEIIFGGTTPTGRFSASLAHGIESPPREDGHVSNDPHLEEVQQPSSGIADSTNYIDGDQISTTTTKQNARRKRPYEFSDAISEQNVSADKRFEKLVEAINGMNKKLENHVSMSNVLAELNSIEGMDHNDYLKLYEMVEKVDAREWFMNMPVNLKKIWVFGVLNC